MRSVSIYFYRSIIIAHLYGRLGGVLCRALCRPRHARCNLHLGLASIALVTTRSLCTLYVAKDEPLPAFLVSYGTTAFPAAKDGAKAMGALKAVWIARDLWGVEIDANKAELHEWLTSQLEADRPITIVEIQPVGQSVRPEVIAWFERVLPQKKKRTILMSAEPKKTIL